MSKNSPIRHARVVMPADAYVPFQPRVKLSTEADARDLQRRLQNAANGPNVLRLGEKRIFTFTFSVLDCAAAVEWLNYENDRPMTEARAHRYASDKSAARWHDAPTAVAFNTKLLVKDGQHRFRVGVLTNTVLTTLVMTGVDDARGLDQGAPRGINITHGVATQHAAIARLMMIILVGGVTKRSNGDVAEFYAENASWIDVGVKLYKNRTLTSAFFAAPIALAARGTRGRERTMVEALATELGSYSYVSNAAQAYARIAAVNKLAARAQSHIGGITLACKLLNVIANHIDGVPVSRNVFASAVGLNRFVPDAVWQPEPVRRDHDRDTDTDQE